MKITIPIDNGHTSEIKVKILVFRIMATNIIKSNRRKKKKVDRRKYYVMPSYLHNTRIHMNIRMSPTCVNKNDGWREHTHTHLHK